MATTEHPTTQLASTSLLQPSIAWPAPRPFGDVPSRTDAGVVAPPAAADAVEPPVVADVVEPVDAEEPGAAPTVLLALGWGVWPCVVILAAVALIVPFIAGLLLVGLVGAVVLPPYLLVRHWRARGDRHVDDRAA